MQLNETQERAPREPSGVGATPGAMPISAARRIDRGGDSTRKLTLRATSMTSVLRIVDDVVWTDSGNE